ncbi:MAG TPA: hypothetical protein VNR11_18450 [Xanthobacteraceae bacterium]|nr:hypothetical protein [Xanthobacteraceae bacterium]
MRLRTRYGPITVGATWRSFANSPDIQKLFRMVSQPAKQKLTPFAGTGSGRKPCHRPGTSCLWGSLYLLLLIAGGVGGLLPANARSIAPEFVQFQTLCTVIKIERSELGTVDPKVVDQLAYEKFARLLVENGLNFPTEHGQQCFPGKVGDPSAARQLSLRFDVVIARAPTSNFPVAVVVVAHSFYPNVSGSPIGWPTQVTFCRTANNLPECAARQAADYYAKEAIRVLLSTKEARDEIARQEQARKARQRR